MFSKLRPHISPINRSIMMAATPIFFLLLLAIWTILNTGLNPVKAQPFSLSAFAVVKRTSANLREGPGTQYRVLGTARKGATLPVIGKYDNELGQRWYKVYLRAFGEVWVAGVVVEISPSDADIPSANLTQQNGNANTALPPDTNNGLPASGTNSGNSGGNNPPNNPLPQPTAVSPQPAMTPDPGA